MDLHGVKEGDHKRGTPKTIYDLIKKNDNIISNPIEAYIGMAIWQTRVLRV